MRRALILLPLLWGAAALAQPAPGAPLTPFGTDAALAAFGQDLTAWQDSLQAVSRRQAEARQRAVARARARCDSATTVHVFPAAIRPTAARAAVVAGTVVDAETGRRAYSDLFMPGPAIRLGPDGQFSVALDSATVADSTRHLMMLHDATGLRQVRLPLRPGDSLAVHLVSCGEALITNDAVGQARVSEGESITNVQTAGVDEGGIVKRHGDMLVILRRGRLFTVDVSGRRPRPVAAVDAFGPGLGDAWYDEMLVVDQTVVVIGYSYRGAGTEINLFRLDDDGSLTYRNTYHLRSTDYYSSRNYASRLVGGRLVFYTPLAARSWAQGVDAVLPAMSRWDGEQSGRFVPIATATRVFRPARPLTDPYNVALHTVTSCAVDRGELDCEATAVVGPFSHTFYMSAEAVYVWLSDWRAPQDSLAPSVLYRMPLDGSAPRALGVAGGPVDQFSFLEADGHLQVLVGAGGGGQWMWSGERDRSGLALLRVPLSRFGDGSADAPASAYRPLPDAGSGPLTNRFVGSRLLYGSAPWGGQASTSQTVVVDWRTGRVDSVAVPHGVERIEVMGEGAVVVGSAEDGLHLTALRLGSAPRVAGSYVMAGAAQGESRSHGFFYRPTSDARGMLGLPVRSGGESRYASLRDGSASVLFLENRGGVLRPLGDLEARPDGNADDGCRASCVDWYGNARPLFLGDRVFALMGYELVEGAVRRGRLRELRRVSFAPTARQSSR